MPGTNIMMLRRDTGNSPPIRKPSYRQAPAERAEIAKQTNEMLQAGIIKVSNSPWSSPVLLVSKKDGSKGFCVDYRALKEITTLTSWPIPLLEEVLDTVSELRPTLWSKIDLKSGYWQVALDPATKDHTGFETADSNYVFKSRYGLGRCGWVFPDS